MSDEPKFVASTIKYSPNKKEQSKGQLDNFLNSRNVFSEIKSVAPTIPTIDISVSTTVFKRNIQKVMDEEPLTNHFFLFSSRRRSEKIRLERERVNDLLSIIDRAIETNRNIIRYNVDVFITQQTLERLALEHAVNLEKYARFILREEDLLARLHIDNLDKVDDEAEERKEKIKSLKIANKRAEAELRTIELRNEILDFIKQNISITDLKPHHKARLMEISINPQGIQTMDLETLEELKGIIVEAQKAELRKSKAEAKEKEDKAEHQNWKNQRQRKKDEL